MVEPKRGKATTERVQESVTEERGSTIVNETVLHFPNGEIKLSRSIDERYWTNTLDITPTAADVLKAQAKSQYEVPAQEATKRDGDRNWHDSMRFVIAGGIVIFAIVMATRHPDAQVGIGIIASVLAGGIVLPSIIDRWKKPPT